MFSSYLSYLVIWQYFSTFLTWNLMYIISLNRHMLVLANIFLYHNFIALKDKINNLVANFWSGISVPVNLTYGCDGLSGKESACQCRKPGFYPWVEKIPWRRKWQPTSVFSSGKFHGQRSLAYCSLWGHKRLDTT